MKSEPITGTTHNPTVFVASACELHVRFHCSSAHCPWSMATYFIGQQIFFFLLGFIHACNWLASAHQSATLFAPSSRLAPVSEVVPKTFSPFFWAVGSVSAESIDLLSWASLFLSLLLMLGICQNAILLLLLYLAQVFLLSMYPSIPVLIADTGASMVRNYGWEWQIAETTLLAVFVAPWFSWKAKRNPSVCI